MTIFLYIVLGISIGVGSTLIFLQERFIRERRLVITASEAAQEKSTTLLKELDEKWELECNQYRQELALIQAELEAHPQECSSPEFSEETLAAKEALIATLEAENSQMREHLATFSSQLAELQGESDFLKGEIKRLEEEKSTLPSDDFIFLAPPGGHLLPGSVARALMKKKET